MDQEPFGIAVKRTNRAYDPQASKRLDGEFWVVFLPHQCDAWDIAGWTDSIAKEGITHEQALADLDQFIAEVAEARAALVAGQEYGEDY